MTKIEQNSGKNKVQVRGNHNTINIDSSSNANITISSTPDYHKKVVLNTKTHPLIGAFLCLIGFIADFITMFSFLTSGKIFNGGAGIRFLYYLMGFIALLFGICFMFFSRMVNREFMKLTRRLCLVKANRRIIIAHVLGSCPNCGGKIVIHQNCIEAYCLRNEKHKFDFDYTKL
jgi:hypothetical protein